MNHTTVLAHAFALAAREVQESGLSARAAYSRIRRDYYRVVGDDADPKILAELAAMGDGRDLGPIWLAASLIKWAFELSPEFTFNPESL